VDSAPTRPDWAEPPGSGTTGRAWHDPAVRGDPRWAWPAVGAIAVGAGLAYGWATDHGDLQLYYAAAVRTMSTSWRAFGYGSFDPTGTVTLDKLPGSFWVQALTVRVAGLSTASLIAPQVAAGVLTVLVMFLAVRASAGARAGVVAAAITAAVPATAVASRGNTADAICVLLLVVAAAIVVRAIASGRLRTLLLAGLIVGLAFQAKMIEAWAVGPAFGLAYAVAAPGQLGRRLARLVLAGVVTVVVSLSWMTVVSLVPAGSRPYVDGSRHNSVYEQVFDYNAAARFGSGPGFGLDGRGAPGGPAPTATATMATATATTTATTTTATTTASGATTASTSPAADRSAPGAVRLVAGPLGRIAGWLLPVAFVAAIGLLIARRRQPRTDPVRAAAILWGTWLVTFAAVFSGARVVLPYYLIALTPPVAALCAIGLRTLYRSMSMSTSASRAVPATVAAVAFAAAAVTIGFLAVSTPSWFVAVAGASLAVGAAILSVAVRGRSAAIAGTAFVLLLVPPAVATIALVAADGGSYDAPLSVHGTLAHPVHVGPAAAAYGGVIRPDMDATAWRELDARRTAYAPSLAGSGRFAVFTSAEASSWVLAGLPAVPIGGYTGFVDAPSLDAMGAMLSRHEIRFAIVPGPADPRAADARIRLIESRCVPVVGGLGPRPAGPRTYVCG
jgi:4-amino-4-deoxy-L-arabinose transferase-like glycosyltransferase